MSKPPEYEKGYQAGLWHGRQSGYARGWEDATAHRSYAANPDMEQMAQVAVVSFVAHAQPGEMFNASDVTNVVTVGLGPMVEAELLRFVDAGELRRDITAASAGLGNWYYRI